MDNLTVTAVLKAQAGQVTVLADSPDKQQDKSGQQPIKQDR